MSEIQYPDVRGWRYRIARFRLVGGTCHECDMKIFPPRNVCPNCGALNHERIRVLSDLPVDDLIAGDQTVRQLADANT